MTRGFAFRTLSSGILAMILAGPGWAGVLGKVVPIGGNASDIVLDEGRGVLYIANFTANRIDVMNTFDLTIGRSINVDPLPGSIALSPDGKYLVVGHYDNQAATAGSVALPQSNALTVLNLDSNAKQTFALGNVPLGVAFGADGLALIFTTGEFFLLDPATGSLRLLETTGAVPKTLPVPPGTFPPNITTASVAASGDKLTIHGFAGSGSGDNQTVHFVYDVRSKNLSLFGVTSSPTLGPRVLSVSRDGQLAVSGWSVDDFRRGVTADFPNPGGLLSVGTHVIDSAAGLIYAQVPPPGPPPPPPASATACLPDGRCLTITNAPSTTPAAPTQPPVLMVVEADNLNVREYLRLRENLAGRSVLNAAGDTMYAISQSGVTVMPVGAALRTVRRVVAAREAVVFQANACDRRVATQEFAITDPGGGRTNFSLSTNDPRVSISLTSTVTPARARISYDPTIFQNLKGTATIEVRLVTTEGVNVLPESTDPRSSLNVAQIIRVLINNHDPDQRGALVSVPGKLVDIVSDALHDRYYVLRQDKNEVLVFNAATHVQITTLRTGVLPTQMAITRDGKYLLVGSDAAQYISVFDLDSLQVDAPIPMPFGHYPRSIAVSGRAVLVASRVAGPKHLISRIDVASRRATVLASLGPFENSINIDTVLVASPSGSSIMAAMPDGTVLLYSAAADAFTIARKDLTALRGAYAASSFDHFVVGNNVFNAALFPVGALDNGAGEVSAGFAFLGQTGLRISSTDAGAAGIIQRVDLNDFQVRGTPTRTVESPLFTPATETTGRFAFRRTLAILTNQSAIVSLSQSGVALLPFAYDAAVPEPQITGVVSAADRSSNVAAGGLVTITGRNLSLLNVATSQTPLPTALAESCVVVNGISIPLVLVSSTQVNAQLPSLVAGRSQIRLRSPAGTSNNYNFTIQAAAPSVFRSNLIETGSGASVVRSENNEVVSDANPIRAGDRLTIFATGLGRTSPAVEDGAAAPSEPLAITNVAPEVTLDGVSLALDYSGLTPGEVGVYQINVSVPGGVRPGSGLPLTIRQGDMATTLGVAVVE